MRVLVIGATGYIGAAATQTLLRAGHDAVGLARTAEAEGRLRELGGGAIRGDVTDAGVLAQAASGFDAVMFTPRVTFAQEAEALAALVTALEGSGKTLIYLSGTGVMSIETPNGEWCDEAIGEKTPFTPLPWIRQRVDAELAFLGAAERGVRAMLLRPAHVWGYGGSTMLRALFQGARATGAAPYVGLGLHAYAHVHVDDLADLCRLVLERGESGATYNGVGGEMNFRDLARATAQVLGCEARSITQAQAQEIWGEWQGRLLFGMSCPARAPQSRALGWAPRRMDLEEDIRDGGYERGPLHDAFDQATQERLGVAHPEKA